MAQPTFDTLKNHSIAKVELLSKYMEKLISILGNRTYYSKLNIFDVYCGEGLYKNGKKGSAIRLIETIVDYLKNKNSSVEHIQITLNDHGFSEIETTKKKVDRIKEYVDKHQLTIDMENKLNIHYLSKDFTVLYDDLCKKLSDSQNNTMNFVFIDPFGYDTTPKQKNYWMLQKVKYCGFYQ